MVGMIGQINSGMEPGERCQSTSFHRTGHCPCFVQRRCLGNSLPGLILGEKPIKGLNNTWFKKRLEKKYLYLRLSGWNKEPSRWLGQVVKPFVCLVGPWNRLQCDPRTQTFAYTNWFASQAKPHKWYRVHFMKGSCFNSMSHEDMFSTVRPFCLHLFAPAIILGFLFGFWSWNHLKLPRATTERSFFLMWPLKDNSANMETPKFKSPLDLSFSHGLSFLNFLWFIDFPTVRSPKSFIFKLAVNPGEPGHQEVGPGPIGPGQTSPGLCSAGPDLGYSWRPSWRHATSNRHLVQQWICWSNSIKFCLPICWPTDWGPSDHGSVFSVGCPMYTPKIAKAHHGDMTFGNSQCYPHWVVMLFVTQRDNEDIIESGWPGTQNWFTPQSTIDPTHRPRRKHHQ